MSDRSYLRIVKNETAREATIYIYGVIGGIDWDTWEEINTASKFSDEFRALEKEADTIHVRINSPGGYVFEGQAIYNTLFASKKKIITYNDGICASMGAVILLAGDEIHAFKNSLLMIHNSSSFYVGNKKEVEEQLAAAEKIDIALGTAIEERLGITAEEVVEKYLNYKDNWYTSSEAKDSGFYDHIIEKNKAKVPTDVMKMKPQQLFQQYAAMAFQFPKPKSKQNTAMSKPNSYPNLEAVLGIESPLAVTENGSYLNEEQKATIENQLTALATSVKTATDARAAAETALKAAQAEHKQTHEAAKKQTQDVLAQFRAAATLAGVENLTEEATAETVSTAITAKINELNAKPGATHTNGAAEDDPEGAHAYIDYESSIYQTN